VTTDLRDERLVAAADEAGMRMDLFVSRRLGTVSRSEVQRLIRAGRVTVDGRPVRSSAPVGSGQSVRVQVPAPEPARPESEPLPLTILHDDADIVVIDKPPGMVVHPGPGHRRGTLVNALLHHVSGLSGIGGQHRPGIVHRLDRGTSGVMVVAKHDRAHRDLARQFHDRVVEKEYAALVWGRPPSGSLVDRPIGRDPRHRQKMSSRARRGRPAVTRILDAEPLGGVTLVRVSIATGRTHQIRVHLSEVGHPVVGDALYGGVRRRLPEGLSALRRLDRPFLHASRIAFDHPADGRRVSFDVPLAMDLADVVSELRRTRR
jgi:23S rRNA pseudouridine1911/1915/1917 synthase